jgi:hypothetical protein
VTTAGPWGQADFGNLGDIDTSVGTVRGVRWWSMDAGDTLVGAFGGTWHEGENLATCRRDHGLTMVINTWAGPRSVSVSALGAIVQAAGVGQRRHPAPDPECTCGFYAFWRPEPLPVYEQYPVIGVIEGYGRTVIGDRGFRCEKAKILGLHLPPTSYAGDGDFLDYLQRTWMDRRGPCGHLAATYKVPVYRSIAQMLRLHPPTQDYAALPTSPAT